MEEKKAHITLRARVFIFFAAFLLALIGLIYAGSFQSSYIVSALESQSGSFQDISQFMAIVEDTMITMREYNWDYDDPDIFTEKLERDLAICDTYISRFNMNLDDISESQYLLTRAVKSTYKSYAGMLEDIMDFVRDGKDDDALSLYDPSAKNCGNFLIQYIQQLLETAIADSGSTYSAVTLLSNHVKDIQTVLAICCLILAFFSAREIWRILNPMLKLAEASRLISRGDFEGPDLPEDRKDEVGDVALAFNQMKHSTAAQMQTLNEKNRIEHELHEQERQTLKMQNLAEREKLQQLRSQVDPHFLFNTLNIISITAAQEDAPRTKELITDLSNLLHYSLLSNDTWVKLPREIRIINGYYDIYHTRFGDRINLKWQIADDIDPTETMVPSFILQPLVENAFRHGLAPKEEGGLVTIQICPIKQWSLLYFCVKDNGVGMEKEQLDSLHTILKEPPDPSSGSEHIGLVNVAARLELTDERCRMIISSHPGRGSRVAVFIPLREESEEYV